jgi:hypothetical protein
MSDDKKTEDITPNVVFTETEPAAPPRKTKKYVIIAVSVVLAVGIILAAILVGMYMFTQAQKDIIQYTMHLGSNKQDVTSDPNENIVQYHVSTANQDAWIINDFNKDLQLTKIVKDGQTNCYLTALNRTRELDPSQITGPDSKDPTEAASLMYQTSDTPIVDTSFLGKTASAACKGVSVYWLYPHCNKENQNVATNGTNMDHPKKKRQTTVDNSPYWCTNNAIAKSPYNSQNYYMACVTGCCMKMCACQVTMNWVVQNGVITCTFTYSNSGCASAFPSNWVYVLKPCNGPRGLNCPGATQSCGCP